MTHCSSLVVHLVQNKRLNLNDDHYFGLEDPMEFLGFVVVEPCLVHKGFSRSVELLKVELAELAKLTEIGAGLVDF